MLTSVRFRMEHTKMEKTELRGAFDRFNTNQIVCVTLHAQKSSKNWTNSLLDDNCLYQFLEPFCVKVQQKTV